MKQEGRPVDPIFEPVEKLFRRYQRGHIVNGGFTGVGLSFKEAPSVNREKYSEAKDVLFSQVEGEFEGWGVLSWEVRQIPTPLPPEQPQFTICPKHVPLEDNYAHTDIHCARLQTEAYAEPGKEIRKILRATLGQRATIEIDAER